MYFFFHKYLHFRKKVIKKKKKKLQSTKPLITELTMKVTRYSLSKIRNNILFRHSKELSRNTERCLVIKLQLLHPLTSFCSTTNFNIHFFSSSFSSSSFFLVTFQAQNSLMSSSVYDYRGIEGNRTESKSLLVCRNAI